MHSILIRNTFGLIFTLLAICGPLAQRADAQVTELEPFWVVVERETEMRCGDSPSWYAISNLKPGQLLRVNAESFDWYRVEYPRGTRVWIDTRDARIIENGARIETTRNASPRALNAAVPTTDSSYRRVTIRSVIPPGTKFRYIGPIQNNQGQTDGYIVPAPEGSQGFVLSSATRRATEQEVQEFLRQRDGEPQPQEPEQPQQPANTGDGSQPATPQQEPARVDPPAQDQEQAPQQPASNPDNSGEESGEEQTEPGEIEMGDDESAREAAAEVEALSELEVVIQRSRQLDEAYAAVASQQTGDAEILPLIDEYRGLIELAVPTELAADVRRFAQARIDLLNIRLEIQKAQAELEAIRNATGEAAENFRELDEALAGRRDYLVVGRLVPSAIYNGKRLPLMYRLQTVDGGSGRTLAYITPNEDIAIDSMLNAIVGVTGETRRQGNSGVRIIQPTVIEVLRSESR